MLNAFAISGLLIVTTNILMAIIMFLQSRKNRQRLHLIWGIFCLSVAIWGFSVFNIAMSSDPQEALMWWKIGYIGVIFIPILFTHFVYIFLNISRRWPVYALYTLGVLYLIANFFSDLFIREVHYMFDQFYYLSPTPLYTSFVVLLFFGLIIYTHILLFRAYVRDKGEEKRRIQYFFLATLIGYAGGSFSFLPVYEVDLYPYLNFTVALYPIIMGYAIIRHHLMNIKILATQLFVVFLWVFIFTRMLMSPLGSEEQVINGILLLSTVLVGIFLIRSVMKEVRLREHIEKLYTKLSKANKHLKELMDIKTEFLQIASHQLRTPLTSLRGLLEMQAKGDFIKLEKQERKKLQAGMLGSANQLNNVVNDLLDAMELEGGDLNFDFTQVNIIKILQETIEMLKPSYDKKGLTINFQEPVNIPEIEADEGYLRQVFLNIINNAEKYTEKGGLSIKVTTSDNKVSILFTDTGIGVDPKEQKKLFGKFVRGKRSALVHTDGSGLGLYIIKKIVDEHCGQVTLVSKGVGQGTTMLVELPLKQP